MCLVNVVPMEASTFVHIQAATSVLAQADGASNTAVAPVAASKNATKPCNPMACAMPIEAIKLFQLEDLSDVLENH